MVDKANKADKNRNAGTPSQADMDLLDLLLQQDGAVELRLDRTIYGAEACGEVPVGGFIIDLLDMPPIPQGKGKPPRDWQAFVFRATYKTKGVDRSKDIVDVEPGEEILVPATFQIAMALQRFAKDPNVLHEIALKPKEKLDIGGGKNFWTYRVVKTGKTEARTSAYALTENKVPAQLPSGEGSDLGSNSTTAKTGETVPAS